MRASIRSYLIAGAALVGAGAVTAAEVVTPVQVINPAQVGSAQLAQAGIRLAAAAVPAIGVGDGQPCTGYHTANCDIWATPTYTPVVLDTTSGSVANIPANLLNAVLNMPRAWIDGMNDWSYALEVTGNWWVYSSTNVLGFDPADPPKITAMTNWLIPFPALSNPLGEHTAWWARANLPMNASCTGTVGPACSDVGPILSKMFVAPSWTLAAGYQFPELYNPVSDAEGAIGEEIPDSVGEKAPWSGSYVKLDPQDPINSVMNYLMADPSTNAPGTLTGAEITAAFKRFGAALMLAFNPVVPKSYLLKGWPYTALTPLFLPLVPALCPTCDPENPGGPPITPSAASSATPAADVSAVVKTAVPQTAQTENFSAGDSAAAAAAEQVDESTTTPARAGSRQARSATSKVESPSAAAAASAAVSEPAGATAEPEAPQAAIADASAEAAESAAIAADLDSVAAADEPADTPAPAETAGKHRRAERSGRGVAGGQADQSAGAADSTAAGSDSAESAD